MLLCSFMSNRHVNKYAVFPIKSLATHLTIVHKLPRKMNGFNMILYVGLVSICLATALTEEEA